jgi:hypothetical protein
MNKVGDNIYIPKGKYNISDDENFPYRILKEIENSTGKIIKVFDYNFYGVDRYIIKLDDESKGKFLKNEGEGRAKIKLEKNDWVQIVDIDAEFGIDALKYNNKIAKIEEIINDTSGDGYGFTIDDEKIAFGEDNLKWISPFKINEIVHVYDKNYGFITKISPYVYISKDTYGNTEQKKRFIYSIKFIDDTVDEPLETARISFFDDNIINFNYQKDDIVIITGDNLKYTKYDRFSSINMGGLKNDLKKQECIVYSNNISEDFILVKFDQGSYTFLYEVPKVILKDTSKIINDLSKISTLINKNDILDINRERFKKIITYIGAKLKK